MRLRLVYSGPLVATQGAADREPPRRAALKHEIRRCFHAQLRWHWQTNAFLSETEAYPSDYDLAPELGLHNGRMRLVDAVASRHERWGYRFVPLVRRGWKVMCELDVLLLRHDPPGALVTAGDVDNRIKTLIDALTLPQQQNQLTGNETPREEETPFYCLLEDDVLVSRLNVETDRLLVPPRGTRSEHNQEVQAVVTATVRPYVATLFNLGFSA
ncbi:hypothetical protein [Devosia sp. Root105]|uniref:hypothetical protein n=1 Tax=Devosia sp. Root105 TaxID=1736423 RepID=UPI0012E3BCD5|nr:hypothetical protein [Devosia sp. Root105]